jgi:glycosyltransferase involved in cell wall biosynthesis
VTAQSAASSAHPGASRGGTIAVFHLAETAGPSRSLEAELGWLAGSGSLEVVVPGRGRVARDFARLGTVTTLDYEALTIPRGPVRLVRTLGRLLREMRAFRAHLRIVRPDLAVIVTATLPAQLIAARLERVPTIVYVGELVHGPSVRPGGVLKRAFGAVLIALTGRLATAVIACSDTVARQFGRRARDRVTTIYPPIPDAFAGGDGDGFRRRNGIAPDDTCVVAIGNITSGRGQDVLIRALPLIRGGARSVHCVIVGAPFPRDQDIGYGDELARLADELGVGEQVIFAGFVDELADALAAADVVVNPARSSESFGRVACEALVAGRPVVATRVGAIPEVLRDGETALLVSPDDPSALAAAIERILGDPELASRLARSGREDVLKRFSPRSSLERFSSVARAAAPGLARAAR